MVGAMKALSLALLALLLGSCTFHSTARHWNGRVGLNGKPVYVKSTTNVGFNFAIILPFLGATEIDSMVGELTSDIAKEDGNKVRVIESGSENYWYGFPPFTWIITPVITTVTADYEPSAVVLEKDLAEQAKEASEDK